MFKIILAIIFVITVLNTLQYNAPVLNEKEQVIHGNDKSSIGTQIKNARLHRRYSQEELAQKAGTNLYQIDKIESGNVTPTTEFITKIQEILGVEISIADNKDFAKTWKPLMDSK